MNSLIECMSPDITEQQFNLGFYSNEEEIQPKFIGIIKEFQVENVNSVGNAEIN